MSLYYKYNNKIGQSQIQPRINMASGVVVTVINAVAMMVTTTIVITAKPANRKSQSDIPPIYKLVGNYKEIRPLQCGWVHSAMTYQGYL